MRFSGLTEEEAKRRLEKFGFNTIVEVKKKTLLEIFLGQYTDIFSLFLLLSAILSFILFLAGYVESYIDSLLIFAILILNGVISTLQEYKAEKTLEKLKELQRSIAKVIRDGVEKEIDSIYVVPGDILLLEEGDKIVADAEILEGEILVDESSLTGESYPIEKKKGDKVFSGTFVVRGRAIAQVFSTGMETKFGKVGRKLQDIEEVSFFKTQLNEFSSALMRYILFMVFVFFTVGFLRSHDFINLLLASVALAVAIVPEGLPMIATITMMQGVKNLAEKNVLVKKMEAVECLGAVDYVVFDKTGTLTKGKLEIKAIEKGALKYLPYSFIPDSSDPVEKAIKEFCYRNRLKRGGKIIKINPFNTKTRTSSLIWKVGKKKFEVIKGAPEIIERLTRRKTKAEKYMKKGFRVISLALREGRKYRFLGNIAFHDPPREDAREAIGGMKRANIVPIMITGDHEITARYIAESLDLPSLLISGEEIEQLDYDKIYEMVKNGAIVYRAFPEQKLKVVEALQKKGKVVAATGDGVNDVLILKKAEIGIAMGERGTEIAKEASDVVLLKDSLSTIVNGIVEGRNIIQNVRKFITYLLTCNISEAIVNVLFPFASVKLVLDAPKLLWINLVTDSIPALSFGFDRAGKKIVEEKPRMFRHLLTEKMKKTMFYIGIEKGVTLFLLFIFTSHLPWDERVAIIFTTIVVGEMIRIFVIRYVFREPFFENRIMLLSLIFVFLLQLTVVYEFPWLFSISPISLTGWMYILAYFFISTGLSFLIASFIRRGK